MKFILVLLAVVLLLKSVSAEVVVLTSENINGTIGKDGLTFVKFYAPWCGHCQKAAPEFSKASDILKDTATFAELNCDDEKETCARFEIDGFPKFMIFQKGVKVSDYDGPRTASAMANFAKAYLAPDTTSVNSNEEFENAKNENPKICLIKTKSNETDLAKSIGEIILKYKSTFHFVLVTDEKVSPDDSMESITVYRKDDDKEVFDGDLNSEALINFLDKASIMFIGSLTPETIPLYSKLARDKVGILLLGQEKTEEHVADIRSVAKKYRNDIIFIGVESETNEVSRNIGLPSDTVFPAFVITSQSSIYAHPTDIQANSRTIGDFIEKHLKGEVNPLIRSQPIPKEPTKDGLTTLVGKTLDSYLKEGKDMLIYIYAPSCGHCQKFHPVYDEFAKAYGSDDLIIGKIDATANDFNRTLFNVTGYPTVCFIPAKSNEAIYYNGDRTVDDLASFVKEHMKGPAEPTNEDTEDGDL
ncbi:unnamed protein product [Phytomonas sp. Hart1]|nr:unnamed protein product [Phytomonas sp. Hart1]|eukprot:CCW70112.1 unnamed protein product [Phytomonas sp. isolate Hart1]